MTIMKPIVLSDKDVSRFWSKVAAKDPVTGCMLWTVGFGMDGRYGRFQVAGKVYYAHRIAYVLANGRQLAEGAFIDHKCHVTQCVNAEHLQEVTAKANSENREGAQRKAKSGIRGVNWNGTHKMWFVRVGHAGKRHFGGYFNDLASAEQAAIALRNSLHTNNLVDRQ
jgi:hypothetical protein